MVDQKHYLVTAFPGIGPYLCLKFFDLAIFKVCNNNLQVKPESAYEYHTILQQFNSNRTALKTKIDNNGKCGVSYKILSPLATRKETIKIKSWTQQI